MNEPSTTGGDPKLSWPPPKFQTRDEIMEERRVKAMELQAEALSSIARSLRVMAVHVGKRGFK